MGTPPDGDKQRSTCTIDGVIAVVGTIRHMSGKPTSQELIVRLLRLGLKPAASAVTAPSGTLHITNLHVDSKFVVVAKVDDVVAAATGASGTS